MNTIVAYQPNSSYFLFQELDDMVPIHRDREGKFAIKRPDCYPPMNIVAK